MSKKTNFGVPILLAAALTLSACVPTPNAENTQATTPEQAVEAGESSGEQQPDENNASEADSDAGVDDVTDSSNEQQTDEVAENTDEVAENTNEVAENTDDAAESTDETETVAESDDNTANDVEADEEDVVDNTPTKVDSAACFSDKVNDRGEIKFAPGTSLGTVDQSVLRDEADLYRFDAQAGQRYEIALNSIEDNAQFSFWAPTTGSVTTENSIGLNGVLEETGTYEICVSSSARNATYELVLSIDA